MGNISLCVIITLMSEFVPSTTWPKNYPIDELDSARIPKMPTILSSTGSFNGPEVRHLAQQIHTQVYLESKFITQDELNEDGIFTDEYSSRSDYLVSNKDNRRSACRYIHADKKAGILSLPTAQHFAVDPEIIKDTAGVHRLSDLKSREVIEVSGLASVRLSTGSESSVRSSKLDATRLLYASILRHSLDEGHKLWLLNTDKHLLRSLELLIGKEQVHRLGEPAEYMGPPTIPVAINPQAVVTAAFEDKSDFGIMKQQYLREQLPGVKAKYLTKATRSALRENEIEVKEDGKLSRTLTNRKALAYAAIIGYSSLRALPVAGVEEFEGSVPLLWGIDVGTAVPYTWGLIETVSAKKTLRRAVGGTVAAGSFIAPYAYFWSEGQDYPAYVNVVAGGLIGLATTLELSKVRKDHYIAASLRAAPTNNDA